jgi:uncharacterized repeat protein (TIGR03803 family)
MVCSENKICQRISTMKPGLRMSIRALLLLLLCVGVAASASAQTFKTMFFFDGTHGEDPGSQPIQGPDGNLYSTTFMGGTYNQGTIYRISPSGKLTTLHNFCAQSGCPDGAGAAGLTLAPDGNFYGETYDGGSTNGAGTIFKITPEGKLTTLYRFCAKAQCADGAQPEQRLFLATDGNFYGTTDGGGTNGFGTIFKVTSKGKLTTIHSFCTKTGCTDGAYPFSSIMQGRDGNFYGTTAEGGIQNQGCARYGCGVAYKLTPQGKYTTLYHFCSQSNCADGAVPQGGSLLQATDGDFYGTTDNGGENDEGTAYKITSTGKATVIHSFCPPTNCDDGAIPYAGLIQGTDGNLYGTASIGGSGGFGLVFKMTLSGVVTSLYSFNINGTDGSFPVNKVFQATDGSFWGTTNQGGNTNCSGGCGTTFRIKDGLGRFVQAVPTVGRVGAKVIILGNDLTGASGVTFNGTSAQFTVISASEIETAVPTGATTGKVKVTRPQGTLVSNVDFRVAQ